MATTKWSDHLFANALQREVGRLYDSADFLTATERDTYIRLLEMIRWVVLDARPWPMGREAHFSDEQIQPLRDWMRDIGAEMQRRMHENGTGGYVFPSFLHATAVEAEGGQTAEIVPFPSKEPS